MLLSLVLRTTGSIRIRVARLVSTIRSDVHVSCDDDAASFAGYEVGDVIMKIRGEFLTIFESIRVPKWLVNVDDREVFEYGCYYSRFVIDVSFRQASQLGEVFLKH